MSIFSWIIVGLLAGIVANLLYPEPSKGGWFAAMLLGILGAIAGGFIFGLITGEDLTTGFNLTSIFVAVVGSLILLFGYNALRGSRHA